MQRVLHKKKKSEPKSAPDRRLAATSASSPSLSRAALSASQSSAGSGRRHAATLYHHKSAAHTTLCSTPPPPRDQVVVGLSASTEDEVEDWSSDFLAAAPRTRWRRQDSVGAEYLLADTLYKRRSSSSSNGVARRGSEVGASSGSSGHVEDDDRGLYSSYSSVKDGARVTRTDQPEDASDSDEDWDAEFGFDEQTDAALGSSDSMDPTRRRAENGNFFLPNLHEVLDGETLPDDDEMDDGVSFSLDGAQRRQRRPSEEPLFQRRRSDFHQSGASVDGSVDGIRSSLTSASASSSNAVEYALVDKLRLLEVANSSAYAVRIERYPKPSSTLSHLERDRTNFPSFTENKYERWLADLVVPDCAIVSHHMEAERNRLPPPRQLKNQQFHALVSLPFGREFVDTFFKQITHYRFFGEDKENRELVRMYFEKVSTTGMTDENWAQNLSPVDLDYVVGCSVEILQEAARLYGPKPVVPLATHLSLSMLSTSSSASSQGNKTTIYWIQQFQDILLHCAEAFPQYSNVIALIELRYVCHHLAGFASGEYEYKWQICNQLPAFLPLEPVMGDSASQIVNEVLQYYGALFQHLNTSPESRSNRYTGHKASGDKRGVLVDETRQYALSSDVFCLQALIMCDIQSLYDSKSALADISLPALEELLEFEDDEATVDPILVGLMPHNRDSRSSSSSSNPDHRDSGYERGDHAKGLGGWSASAKLFELLRPSSRSRNSALSFFYERIPAGKFQLVKAKCACVLAAMHVSTTTSHGNLRVAESLAYEALRLLESCSKKAVAKLSKMPSLRSRDKTVPVPYLSIFNNDGLLSDLGREALECLGNILIKNSKYRYGILCLEAAGAIFTFLNQGCEYEKLDRLLCKLTLEADDVHRALPLHEKVTCAAQRQGNITVYVYLTQEMTKLWIREGNFTRAEEYLATACHFLRDHTNLLPPHFLSSVINGSYSSSEAPSSRSGTMMTATSSSVSSSLSGSFHLSSRSTGNAGEVDTWLNHDINLHLLVRDVYRSSGRCLEGMRVLEHLLNYSSRLPRGKRTQLRMLLAEDALKMRVFDTCRHMFSLMEREATAFCDRLQENIKGFSGPGSSSGTGPGTSSSGGGRSLGGMGSEARYCFDMSFTLRYIMCRVKMYLKLKDFGNAYAWLSLAHVKNDRDNVRKQAQLYVLDGKLLRAFCREQQEREWEMRRDGEEPTRRGRTGSTFVGSVVSPAQVEEMLKPLGVSLYGLNKDEKQRLNERIVQFATCVRDVDKAEEQAQNAFWTAFDLYRVLDDSLYQLKVLLEIVSFMLAPIQRSFFALGSNQDDEMLKSHLHRRSSGKESSGALELEDLGGDDTIEKTRKTLLEAQKLLRPALNLAEQVASPACFLQTLIFCSEVWVWLERIASYKSEKHLKEATAFWEEAVRVMKGVFFRRVAFHDVADAQMLHSSGFGNDFSMPFPRGLNKGRFCVVPILNFSEGFIVKLEAMTLQLILAACQLQQFERVPEYVEETLLAHLDELLSARMCLSSIVYQLQTFRALQRSHKRLPPTGSTSNLAAAAMPSGSSVSVSSVGSNNSRSSSFSAVIPVPSPQMSASSKQVVSTPSPSGAGVAGKRAGHKKNQSMSSISELLASNPYQEGAASYGAPGGIKSSATPRTGLASLSERPNVPPPSTTTGKSGATAHIGHTSKKSSERKPRRYTRERSRSAPQPAVPNYPSPGAELTLDGLVHEGGSMPVLAESGESSDGSLKRTSSVKFIDLGDLRSLPPGEDFVLGRSDGFGRDEGSSSNGAIGLCDFDEVQSEKLWWIFNLWRNAKSKYVEGKIETSEFRSCNLRYLRTLLDAFDPQQIAVLYFGGPESASTDSAVTPGGTRVPSDVNTGNPNGMLDFDVSRMNSHALIQDRQLVLSIGYEYSAEVRTPFGTHPKLQFKVFGVREGDTRAWRQEIPRPEWYLSEYDMLEAEDAAVGAGVLRSMRLLGAKLLVKLLGVLLLENSVVVVGNSYPQIQEVTTSLLKLLEPFRWQHTFLPFVPVTSWRLLHDAVYQHAQAELAARPKSRRSFSRLSHDWRAWSSGSGSATGSSYSSSRGSTDSLNGGNSSTTGSVEPTEEEPPFLLGATADTWHSCLAFSKKCGNDPRLLSSCVVVVDLDDVDSLATDKTFRNAVPLPKKWRRQFLERIEKITRQRLKMRTKMGRRHSSQQLVSSRGPTTPASVSGASSMRSPVGAYPSVDVTLRSFDDAHSTSRSGSSWMMTPASASNVSDPDSNYQGVQSSDPNGLDERKHYDSECAAALVSGLRELYDKLLVLCAEKERKAKGSKKKKSSSSSGHSKRQEIKSWFSSSHDFDAFVDNFQNTDLLEVFEKEKAAAQEEAQAQARATLERQSSEHEVSSTSSGRSTRFGTTPKAIVNSFTPQQLKSLGSFSSLTASNRSSGGRERRR
ncbi:DENN (AEX-3) domain-containing protein [Phytophthora infestans]|uniref:DENN (AEX-3) domain-containing protein n=1 Tax=Phytophthora infestans TaxID=4787 RepID=A0A8S9UEP9_PHYIN|nr:DENN (AEX-3) domain-containing protein [Phytophthora infestans]